jgi:small conductance mechanosensitive channel
MTTAHYDLQTLLKLGFHKAANATPSIISGIVVFIIFWVAGILTKRFIIRLANNSKSRQYLLKMLGQTAKITLILVGLVTALGTMGINVTALVTSLGLAGFALGFALKDTLSNTLAGFIILFYQPFNISDRIDVSKVEGEVIDINLRYTVLKTEEERHMVPNATVLTSVVTIKEKHKAPMPL